MKAICNLDVPVDSKAPKPSSQTEKVPQGKKLGAKGGLRRKQSSKLTSESKTEESKSKTGQSEKDTQSSLAKDKSPSHPSPPTPVVGEMHKEAHRAAYGPTSLGATSEDRVHPQLSSDESEEEVEADNDKDTHATSHDVPEDTSIPYPLSSKSARPSYLDINQLTDLLVPSLKPELSKLLASHNFANCLPTELKELPPKFTELFGEFKELKQHVTNMEIELPRNLKEIPTKLETFTSTISSPTS
ncbi:hypothetical protein Tco_1575574 [Tanacetum coccineum]